MTIISRVVLLGFGLATSFEVAADVKCVRTIEDVYMIHAEGSHDAILVSLKDGRDIYFAHTPKVKTKTQRHTQILRVAAEKERKIIISYKRRV